MIKQLTNKISLWRQLLIVAIVVCFISTGCYFFSAYVGYRVVALILLMTVSLLAMFFDILPVLIAALISALIWNFFFIPPKFTFSIGSTEDALMFLMYFVIASLNAVLTYKIRQMEKLAKQKEEEQKTLQLYNTLLNSLSHELRTPISTIIAATDNLSANAENISEEDKNALLSEISTASFRLNQQVENLLNMSRIEASMLQLKTDWCDINELIYNTLNQLQEELKEHHIKVSVPSDLPLFKLDYGLMQTVLSNIIRNAALYTAHGSEIKITAAKNRSTKEIPNQRAD